MDVAFQRRLDRLAGTWILRAFSLFSRHRGPEASEKTPGRILVILLSEMGSLVLAKPMFARIREKYPESSVHVLVFEQNLEVMELLGEVAPACILTVSNRSLGRFLWDSLKVFAAFRRIRFDAVIDGELFSRVSSIYAFLSGAVTKAGFHPHTQEGLYRGGFINRPVLYNPYTHISEQFINLVEALDSEGRPLVKRRVDEEALKIGPLEVDQGEIDASLKRFEAAFPHVS